MPKLRKNTYAMRYVAGQPAERILPPGAFAGVSPVYPAGTPLSSDEKIRVLVWNIFKQQRAEWQSVLKNFGKDAHLVLLQEAQTTPELVRFATSNYLAADQVPALAEERDQQWRRVGEAPFLTDAEKRAALGLPPLPEE